MNSKTTIWFLGSFVFFKTFVVLFNVWVYAVSFSEYLKYPKTFDLISLLWAGFSTIIADALLITIAAYFLLPAYKEYREEKLMKRLNKEMDTIIPSTK